MKLIVYIYFTRVINKFKLSSECFALVTKKRNECLKTVAVGVSENSTAGVGLCVNPLKLAPFRESPVF